MVTVDYTTVQLRRGLLLIREFAVKVSGDDGCRTWRSSCSARLGIIQDVIGRYSSSSNHTGSLTRMYGYFTPLLV